MITKTFNKTLTQQRKCIIEFLLEFSCKSVPFGRLSFLLLFINCALREQKSKSAYWRKKSTPQLRRLDVRDVGMAESRGQRSSAATPGVLDKFPRPERKVQKCSRGHYEVTAGLGHMRGHSPQRWGSEGIEEDGLDWPGELGTWDLKDTGAHKASRLDVGRKGVMHLTPARVVLPVLCKRHHTSQHTTAWDWRRFLRDAYLLYSRLLRK